MEPKQLQELTDKVGSIVSGAIAPLKTAQETTTAENAALKVKVAELETKLTEVEARPEPKGRREVYRVDQNGRTVQLFAGVSDDPNADGVPGFLKNYNQNSKPLQVTNILRGVMGKDMTKYASEEMAFSQKIRGKGYNTEFLGSLLFPMGEELFPKESADGGDYSEIRKESEERLTIQFDRGELGWIAKRFPDFAQRMFPQINKTAGDMMVSDDALGGYLIPTVYGDRIIDLLRNRLTIMRAGATEMTLPPSGNLTWVRLTEDPVPSYTDPDTTTDGTSTTPRLAPIRLQAKSLKAWVSIPNDLIRYASPSVELLVRMALAAKFAVAEDKQFLEGIGTTLAPNGLINYALSAAEVPAPGKITLHAAKTVATDGNTFGVEDVARIMALYYLGNDPDPPTGWIMRPMMWAAIMNRRADVLTVGDGLGPFLFWTSRGQAQTAIPDALAGYPIYPSAQVSGARAKGSGTNLTYVLFGNFRRVLIGRVGTMELAVSEHVKFFQDKLVIRAVERHDMAVEHEESFCLTDTLIEA